jgi:predicted kinase
MPTLTIVVGLPGSGKSEYIREYRAADPAALVVDDYHAGARDDSPAVTAGRAYPDLITILRDGRDALVADIAFTDTWRREELARVVTSDVPGVVLDWVYFENDLTACLANIARRNRPSRATEEWAAREFAPRYFVPLGVVARPVWRASDREPV